MCHDVLALSFWTAQTWQRHCDAAGSAQGDGRRNLLTHASQLVRGPGMFVVSVCRVFALYFDMSEASLGVICHVHRREDMIRGWFHGKIIYEYQLW